MFQTEEKAHLCTSPFPVFVDTCTFLICQYFEIYLSMVLIQRGDTIFTTSNFSSIVLIP